MPFFALRSNRALALLHARRLLGGALPMLAILVLLVPSVADLEDGRVAATTAEPPQLQTAGLSLMQSGKGSVLPVVNQKVAGVTFRDNFEDDLAELEDEFDDSVAQPQLDPSTSGVVGPNAHLVNKLGDSPRYAEAVFVIIAFAFVTHVFKRARSKPLAKAADCSSPAKPQVSAAALAVSSGIQILGASEGFAALEEAVRVGDEVACLQLLRQGGRWAVRQEDACGCTALHIAAHHGSVAMTRLLLDHRAKVDAREAWEETPLHMAARRGSVEVCELLLARGADIDAANSHGWTPLLCAGEARQEAVCEFLLSRGAGVGGASDDGLPPLINALLFRRILTGGKPSQVNSPRDDHANEAMDGNSAASDELSVSCQRTSAVEE